ncbi:MAG: flagellar biosynthetic protein FliR [Pseudomonadota bacterium]|nr:flagellar biosynthetic protein FliR [Pseudomonadota bacterium]
MELIAALQPLVELGVGPIAIVAGVFVRLSALVFLLPGMGERAVSPRIRLAAALAMTLVLMPIVMAASPATPQAPSAIALTLCAEAVCGALIGFSIRIAVWAIQTAGSIAAQHLSLSQIFGGGLDDAPEPPIATLMMVAAIAVAVSSGVHFKAVSALAVSYDVMPFGTFPGAEQAGRWAADRAGFAFASALSLALPFVVLGFMYNLAIGAANRAMPQLMVAFVGAPAITLAGLVLLAASTPLLLGVWSDMLDRIFATLMGAAR